MLALTRLVRYIICDLSREKSHIRSINHVKIGLEYNEGAYSKYNICNLYMGYITYYYELYSKGYRLEVYTRDRLTSRFCYVINDKILLRTVYQNYSHSTYKYDLTNNTLINIYKRTNVFSAERYCNMEVDYDYVNNVLDTIKISEYQFFKLHVVIIKYNAGSICEILVNTSKYYRLYRI